MVSQSVVVTYEVAIFKSTKNFLTFPNASKVYLVLVRPFLRSLLMFMSCLSHYSQLPQLCYFTDISTFSRLVNLGHFLKHFLIDRLTSAMGR